MSPAPQPRAREFLASLGLAVLLGATPCAASSPEEEVAPKGCASAAPGERVLESRIGSAGILYNLAEHPKSIRTIAAHLLEDALKTEAPAGEPCGPGCVPREPPEIVYRVAPKVFLATAEQQALCLRLEEETRATPLVFPVQDFKSVEALNTWVMEFSQGRGELGKELYERCGGNCSPRYEFRITQDDGGFQVHTAVTCGLARDRASDDYEVSTAVRPRCLTPAASGH